MNSKDISTPRKQQLSGSSDVKKSGKSWDFFPEGSEPPSFTFIPSTNTTASIPQFKFDGSSTSAFNFNPSAAAFNFGAKSNKSVDSVFQIGLSTFKGPPSTTPPVRREEVLDLTSCTTSKAFDDVLARSHGVGDVSQKFGRFDERTSNVPSTAAPIYTSNNTFTKLQNDQSNIASPCSPMIDSSFNMLTSPAKPARGSVTPIRSKNPASFAENLSSPAVSTNLKQNIRAVQSKSVVPSSKHPRVAIPFLVEEPGYQATWYHSITAHSEYMHTSFEELHLESSVAANKPQIAPWKRPEASVLTQKFKSAVLSGKTSFSHAAMFTTSALLSTKEALDLPFTRLLGSVQGTTEADDCLWLNCNVPQSTVICGVRGSGKSYTTSVFLENCLVNDERIGDSPQPMSSLVLHYDRDSSADKLPCEAAYLASKIPVLILVSNSNLFTMRKVYAKITNVTVLPLLFENNDLSFDVMTKLMGLSEGGVKPLYMSVMQTLLQETHAASQGGSFDFSSFIRELESLEVFNPARPSKNDDLKLNVAQKESLNQRLRLLKGMSLAHQADRAFLRGQSIEALQNARSTWFKPGQLTITDLSDPFIDSTFASSLLEILLNAFQSQKVIGPKLLCLDEAHKYIRDAASPLTESVLHSIRLQRHNGMRIILSTQEPTIVPSAILDLSTNIIIHRFSSPAWINHLSKHICSEDTTTELFDIISRLDNGEALIFSPTGVISDEGKACKMGRNYAFTKIRRRVTTDGGTSVMAV